MKKFACKDFFTLYFNGRLLFACSKEYTIEIACIRNMIKLINLKTRDYYRSVSLDALTPVSEPSYEIKEEVAQDYTLYEKIVSSLNLTENMRIALECRKTA